MMHTLKIFLLTALLLSFGTALQASDWKIYASYHQATHAVKADARIFVLANGDLFSYDTEDQTVETYDKTQSLSDFGIKTMAYSADTRQLVLVYDNGNIDLLGLDGETWNMPEMKNKDLGDKTVNELKVVGSEALISLNAGLVLIDLTKKYFVAFYDLGTVRNATIQDGKIYANTTTGVVEGNRAKNLLDPTNWTASTATVTFGTTAEEQAAETALLEQVANMVPDSPQRNYAYQLNLQGQRLLMTGGTFNYSGVSHVGTVQQYENGKWTLFDEEAIAATVPSGSYKNVTDVVQDPSDAQHHWVSSQGSGLYEFRNQQFVSHYDSDNSPLTSILPNAGTYYNYVWLTGLAYDPEGNLWMLNNQCDTIVRICKANGTWKAYHYDDVAYYETFDHTVFDRRGWAWINSRRTTNMSSITGVVSVGGMLVVNTNGTIDTQEDDQHTFISSFYNQDGTRYTPNLYYCAAEDADGAMWIGTSDGLFVSYTPSQVFGSEPTLSQVKVARDDDTGLADYLLNEVGVKCIAIDGGNRKWIGTVDNGVYLVSADGQETIHHFTAEETPLISNEINDIAIDGTTGEVFIATSKGLCSYMGDATDPSSEMKSDNLKVWPNPVRPDYQGSVHISGLMFNSTVKIVSAAGRLVSEGISVGGEFSWNCCYQSGHRVASGIYYALCTDEDGNKGAVAKILIIK